MIALHACDIATDYAIHMGIRSGASIIMCSPCCHKQIRLQIQSPALLKPMLQYGLHMGQQAEMVTDSLRALFLEACGYETKVFEFISLEHTNKNKMILAVKRAEPLDPAELLVKIQELKVFYGIQEQCLETLLQADGYLSDIAVCGASLLLADSLSDIPLDAIASGWLARGCNSCFTPAARRSRSPRQRRSRSSAQCARRKTAPKSAIVKNSCTS